MDSKQVFITVLLYGDHFPLHERLLSKLNVVLPPEVKVRVWYNAPAPQTTAFLKQIKSDRFDVTYSPENIPKYKVMRMLVNQHIATETSPYRWFLWFDDDTDIVATDWWEKTKAYLDAKAAHNVCYVGQPWFVHHLPGQWDFIKTRPWFKGKAPELIKGRPGVSFAQGSYWWLRTDVMKQIGWPDTELSHNGGDTLLGEAIRQQGLPFDRFSYGVKPNDAKRRGITERPAGSTVECRR